MQRAKDILNGSYLWRSLMALCLWFGGQWRSSGVVQWFLHPRGWNRGASEGSVFYKLWAWALGELRWVYEKLRLDKLFAGSVFLRLWVWCAIPVVIAPAFSILRPSLIIMLLCLV